MNYLLPSLGDGTSCSQFCHTLSRFDQQIEASKPFPIFEQRLWRKAECDRAVFLVPKQCRDAVPFEKVANISSTCQQDFVPLNLHFSGKKQLQTLRKLAGENNISRQDALSDYIVAFRIRSLLQAEFRMILVILIP